MTRRTAFALAAMTLLLVLVLLAPVPGFTRWMQTLHNSAHGPIFAAVAVLCMIALRDVQRLRGAAVWQYASALLASAILGAATELLQIPIDRDASLQDFGNDVLGALAGLGVFAAFDRSLGQAVRMRAAAMALTFIVVLAVPLAAVSAAYVRRHAAFPAIADFSQRLDSYFIAPQGAHLERARVPEAWAMAPDEHAARLRFLEGPWPGLVFHEPVPDWRGNATLALDVINPREAPLALVLRVHDAAHDQRHEDRFNRAFLLQPCTRTTLRVPVADIERAPADRPLDMRSVAGLVLFCSSDCGTAEMYVSKVWLE